MEIDDVTDKGKCMKCGSEVSVDTTPREVKETMLRDKMKPVKKILINDRYHKITENSCEFCYQMYETPYVNSRYCSDDCKKANARRRERERRTGKKTCLFCDKIINSTDKRRKFCNTQCREDMRN